MCVFPRVLLWKVFKHTQNPEEVVEVNPTSQHPASTAVRVVPSWSTPRHSPSAFVRPGLQAPLTCLPSSSADVPLGGSWKVGAMSCLCFQHVFSSCSSTNCVVNITFTWLNFFYIYMNENLFSGSWQSDVGQVSMGCRCVCFEVFLVREGRSQPPRLHVASENLPLPTSRGLCSLAQLHCHS